MYVQNNNFSLSLKIFNIFCKYSSRFDLIDSRPFSSPIPQLNL